MTFEIGQVEAIYRYPVKSMRGELLDAAALGWLGVEGDRRFAFRRLGDRSGFPWLTAGKFTDLVRFTPQLPSHVLTPEGQEMELFGEALAAEVGRRCGISVEMMQFKNGIFDDASMSVITSDTVREIGRLAAKTVDVRRFRPNIVVRSARAVPFEEDDWIGGMLTFGDGAATPAVTVMMPDARCAMINIDPDDGSLSPELLKAVVHANQKNAGVYSTVTRIGRLAVGQPIFLHR